MFCALTGLGPQLTAWEFLDSIQVSVVWAILPTNPCNLPFPKPTDTSSSSIPFENLQIHLGALPPTFSHILLSPFLGKFVYKWSRMTVLRSSFYFSGFFITFIHYLMISLLWMKWMSLFHSFAPSIPHTYIFPLSPSNSFITVLG